LRKFKSLIEDSICSYFYIF